MPVMGQTSYVTVKNPDGTYSWKEISSNGGGAAPSDELPLANGDADPGTSLLYSRGDHVHPHDDFKQDLLQSGINIKTVGGNSLIGEGDIPYAKVEGTGDVNILEGIKLSDSTQSYKVPIDDEKNADAQFKTVNGMSIIGTGNVDIPVGIKTLKIGNTTYDGTADVTVPSYTTPIEKTLTLTSLENQWTFNTKDKYCDKDLKLTVKPQIAKGKVDAQLERISGTAHMLAGNGVDYYTSSIGDWKPNAPTCVFKATGKYNVTQKGWVNATPAADVEQKTYYLSKVVMEKGDGLRVEFPDGTIWKIECKSDGTYYIY